MKTISPERNANCQISSPPTEQPARQAVVFLVYDLILVVLARVSPNTWITVPCVLLFAIAAIRAITLFAEAIFCSEVIEEEFGLRLDESQD